MDHGAMRDWMRFEPGVDPKIGVPVRFRAVEFMDFVSSLYHDYPDEWVAMAVEHEDRDTGEIAGTIIAHSGGLYGMAPAAMYHRAYPEGVVRLFSTRMTGPPRRVR
ncbi:MAG TPA: hypothetical protein VH916_01580 [Dehalococcoidia bacterium]|jgi:hypothetical protein